MIEASYIKLADQPNSKPSVEIRPPWLHLLKKELKRKETKVNLNTGIKINKRCHNMTLRSKKKVEGAA